MKFCSRCGAEMAEEAIICVKCGCAVEERKKGGDDKPLKGGGLGFVLTFFLGIVGFVLCLCLGNESCKRAAKITLSIYVIFVIILIIIYSVYMSSLINYYTPYY